MVQKHLHGSADTITPIAFERRLPAQEHHEAPIARSPHAKTDVENFPVGRKQSATDVTPRIPHHSYPAGFMKIIGFPSPIPGNADRVAPKRNDDSKQDRHAAANRPDNTVPLSAGFAIPRRIPSAEMGTSWIHVDAPALNMIKWPHSLGKAPI